MGRTLPVIAFVLSAMVLAFLAGVFVVHERVFPYPQLRDGVKTIRFQSEQLFGEPFIGAFDASPETDIPLDQMAGRRFHPLAPGRMGPENMLMVGGLNQYLDICGGLGCLAVEVDRSGEIVEGVPFRPGDILAADVTDGAFAREGLADRPELVIRPIGAAPYPDGDLLITFQGIGETSAFPYSMGVGRIARDGTPRWFRFDYSHHWPTLGPDGLALVPSLDIAGGEMRVRVGDDERRIPCKDGKPIIDFVKIVDGDGKVVREIDIADQIATGPWSMAVLETTDGCDPLHVNFIDRVGEHAAPEAGLAPGDLVVSMRNISAIAILDGETGTLKRLVRGGFAQQHSVRFLDGSRLLLFDNWGGDADGPPSRLLELDLATGAERRVFPPAGGYEGAPLYSRVASHIDISDDRKRALVAFSEEERVFEIDISSGEPLMVYEGLHDLSSVPEAPERLREKAARGQIFAAYYAP